jgi:hypothetical protein
VRAVAQTRREFLGHVALSGAAMALLGTPESAAGTGWFAAAQSPAPDLLHETYDGLIAFVVPGRDAWSVAQGVATSGPGGAEAGVTDALIATIDASTPYIPNFAHVVAAILNDLALAVNAGAQGSFASAFARLSWGEKAAVIHIMDATPSLQLLGSVLPAFVAFFVYSEAGAYDPATRSLTGRPLGWDLANYTGVADGRAEFLGYLRRG